MMPSTKCMICADMNADPEDIPEFQSMIAEDWVDVGGIANIWGRQAAEGTCRQHAEAKLTRRDFIVVNDLLWPHITDFEVIKDALFQHTRQYKLGSSWMLRRPSCYSQKF